LTIGYVDASTFEDLADLFDPNSDLNLDKDTTRKAAIQDNLVALGGARDVTLPDGGEGLDWAYTDSSFNRGYNNSASRIIKDQVDEILRQRGLSEDLQVDGLNRRFLHYFSAQDRRGLNELKADSELPKTPPWQKDPANDPEQGKLLLQQYINQHPGDAATGAAAFFDLAEGYDLGRWHEGALDLIKSGSLESADMERLIGDNVSTGADVGAIREKQRQMSLPEAARDRANQRRQSAGELIGREQ
jgi:hypothetical protein